MPIHYPIVKHGKKKSAAIRRWSMPTISARSRIAATLQIGAASTHLGLSAVL